MASDLLRRQYDEMVSDNATLTAQLAAVTAERDALRARAERAESALEVAEQVIADVQFDLINCHSQNACAHIQDALNIVNRHCAALAAASEGE